MSRNMAGVALITSLILLSVITLLVMAMTTRQQLDLQRATHFGHAAQALWYSHSAETWAKRVLNSDDKEVDSLHDNWAVSVPPMAIEEGLVAGSIVDLQSRFNLNNLLQAGKPHPPSVAHFQRLLTRLDIDPTWVPALLDWLDEDSTESPSGAEDSYYANLQPPYRAANALMADPSELRLVRGVDDRAYSRLRPFICALPATTGININTAPPLVLDTITENHALDVDAIISDRERSAINDSNQLKRYFPTSTLTAGPAQEPPWQSAGLVIASRYFQMTTEVRLGVSRQRRVIRLFRNGQDTVSLNQSPVTD